MADTDKQEKSPAAEREERILKFWQDNNMFEKSLEKESPKGEFVFYDGPPFATGLPHYGHILASTIKDLVPRYWTMKGYKVERKWGWDCHGLPIENIVEKDLGISGRKQIEEFGVEKFNEHARSKVLSYVNDWKRTIERIARWVDFDGSYKTMDDSYIESVWWALKKMNEKGLIYEGVKVLPYCPRCETPIANSEIAMDNSYKDITDISVYVKFELVDEPGTFLIAWTTTPWTLPGNTAIAINNELVYVKAKKDGVLVIVSKESVERLLKTDFEVVDEFKGEKIVGLSYKPVFDYYKDVAIPNKKNIWKVWHADFVTTEKGTGIAHEAPAFGEEDMVLAKTNNIPFIKHVGGDGKFVAEVIDFAGIVVKPKSSEKDGHQSTDVEIIKYLAKKGALFSKEKIVHSYPHCFRCETPLYYYALPSWFINIQEVKPKLLELNNDINWIPDHLKEGRFKKSMEGAPDWNISRNRYWASPLPFWKCDTCANFEVLGSISDIKIKTRRNKYFVVRHGEGDHNVLNVLSSKADNPHHLTDRGREQVVLSSQMLMDKNIDLIISSPFVRTRETVDVMVETIAYKGKTETDDRLKEFDFGDFNGQDVERYHSYFSSVGERITKRLPNGENINDVKLRIGEFMYEIDQKYEGKNIVIVTHCGPATLLYATAEGANDKRIVELWGIDQDFLSFGQIMEIDFAYLPHNKRYELDLHRPYSDAITWKCICGGMMKRTPEVIDCWFESGSMPFAQKHVPFENEEWFKKHFPSQFVVEYIAQTRTWFYYMHAISTILFGKAPFENVVTTGTVLAEDGQKMSKSKNNFPDPWILLDKYGADPLRYYLLSSPLMKSEDLNFSEKGVDEVNKKILLRLQNVVSFYALYAPREAASADWGGADSECVLDKWILARLNETGTEMTRAFDAYEIDRGVRPIMDFIDDLSTWYLRRSRDRFKSSDSAEATSDKDDAIATTRYVLLELSKLIAPVMPFYAEELYQKVKVVDGKESVHLENWTDFTKHPLTPSLAKEGEARSSEQGVLEDMKQVREIVEKGLNLRNEANVKVRQPLASFTFEKRETELAPEYLAIIADELNVKEVKAGDKNNLDTEITLELKAEGAMRDLVRAIQDTRKKEDWQTSDRGTLIISEKLKETVSIFEDEIKKVAGISSITYENIEVDFKLSKAE